MVSDKVSMAVQVKVMNVAGFNSAIAACVRNNDICSAETWLERMIAAGVLPDEYSFNMIIGAHAAGKDAHFGRQRAEFWLSRMRLACVQPTTHSFTALIASCARLADPTVASIWFQKLLDEGCVPTRSTHDAMITAYRAAGATDQAEAWRQQFSDSASQSQPLFSGSTSARESYEALIKSRSNRGNVVQAEALLAEMRRHGLEPSIATLNSVIHACTQCGDINRAEMYLRAMESGNLNLGDARPNVITYNTVINCCAEKGEAERAETLLVHMIDKGHTPNEVTFGTICKAFARQGNVPAVERIMNALESGGQPLNEYFFASLISACGAACPPDHARAERAIKELKDRGLRPLSVRRVLSGVVGEARTAELLAADGSVEDRYAAVVGVTRCKDARCLGRRRGGRKASAASAM